MYSSPRLINRTLHERAVDGVAVRNGISAQRLTSDRLRIAFRVSMRPPIDRNTLHITVNLRRVFILVSNCR